MAFTDIVTTFTASQPACVYTGGFVASVRVGVVFGCACAFCSGCCGAFGLGGNNNMASSILREMEKKYPQIEVYKVLAYMPGKKSEYTPSREENTIYPEGLETGPRKLAIVHRNRWMVEQSDYLISYVRTSYGGAYDAMQYAHRKGKQIINLADSEI